MPSLRNIVTVLWNLYSLRELIVKQPCHPIEDTTPRFCYVCFNCNKWYTVIIIQLHPAISLHSLMRNSIMNLSWFHYRKWNKLKWMNDCCINWMSDCRKWSFMKPLPPFQFSCWLMNSLIELNFFNSFNSFHQFQQQLTEIERQLVELR